MQIRFGYVAIALNLKDSSTSKTITLSNLQKMPDNEQKLLRLRRIAKENLENTLRVIKYNVGEKIHVYRLTSKLIPFATYPLDFEWNYIEHFSKEFEAIGNLIKKNNMRVSAHPDHFTVVNSPDEKVFADSVKDLVYHDNIFKAMGLDEQYKLVIHLGGVYSNKDESMKRFIRNFLRLPESVQARIILENDDKLYTAEDILKICQEIKIPMILDIHHHECNPSGLTLFSLLPEIWDTWHGRRPKVHISSPKSPKSFRHHADYINPSTVESFLDIAKSSDLDFDIMVEAKMKDKAMFKLVADLNENPQIELIDPTTLTFK